MTRPGHALAAAVLGLSLVGLGFGASRQEMSMTPAERMDKLFDFWNRLDQPGFAVVVVKDGKVVYQKVFGLACQEHAVAITPDSLFNTATLAQAMVGQAVAMLESQGRLSLADDVRKLIPELPDFGTPVTLGHLLYHSSGLRDWLPVLQLTGGDKAEITLADVLKVVKAQKRLLFPPGDRFEYSNTNYDLLAEAVKRATGRPFSDWAWENIFKPLKMTRTQFRDHYRAVLEAQAFSYNFTRQEYLKGIDTLSVVGSHSLFTSIADLSKWLLSLGTGQAGGPALAAKMFTAGKLSGGRSSDFGYGLKVGTRSGRRVVSQTGTWAGSGADLAYFPDQNFGFAVLANWDYARADDFGEAIAEIYLAPVAPPQAKPSPPRPAGKSVKVSPDILDRYVGDYRLGEGQVLTISRSAAQLILSIPGQRFPLTAVSETEFLFEPAQASLVFQKDETGRVRRFLWKQGGNETAAPRVVLVKPTPQELQEFAGAYANEELNLRLVLEVRGEAVVLIPPKEGEVRLRPDEKDRFVSNAPAFPRIEFRRDPQGRVTGFAIDSPSVRDLVFKKD